MLRASGATRATQTQIPPEAESGTADPTLLIDEHGTITHANAAFLALTGWPSERIVGRRASRVASALLVRSHLGPLLRASQSEAPLLFEIEHCLSGGEPRRLQIALAPSPRPDGGTSGRVVTLRQMNQLEELQTHIETEAAFERALSTAVRRVADAATLEQAAGTLCEELTALPAIDTALVCAFTGDRVRVCGISKPSGYPVSAGDWLPEPRASDIRERTAAGAWAQYISADSADQEFLRELAVAGLRAVACGPIIHGDHADGALLLGTFNESFATTLVERMPGVLSCGTTSSGLLAERLHAWRWRTEMRESVESVLASLAFKPVFQPIIELDGGAVVGYEALTRFASGQRPDFCFAQAWSVGLGAELELATLRAAIEAGKALPAGSWLSLNVSPRLLEESAGLRALLESVDRPVVLEITEHDLITNYPEIRQAIGQLGDGVRLAVDDAGAGAANFSHIIELRPDLIKLDISLVRGVNANLGRQAMVVGMRHFSRTVGCELLAEGIETLEEAETLRSLGVGLGQGFLFGRPAPIESWKPRPGSAMPRPTRDRSVERVLPFPRALPRVGGRLGDRRVPPDTAGARARKLSSPPDVGVSPQGWAPSWSIKRAGRTHGRGGGTAGNP